MWGWGESQNNQENGSSELESRIDDQNQLISQLKEVIRENEAKLVEKEKLIEENKASYSKYKLQTKAKINQLTNQLSENKKQIRDCASPLRRDEEDDVSSEGSRGSYVAEQSSRAKLILLRKQLDDSRLLNEKQEKNLEDLNSRIENLEKLVLEKEESIEELKKNNSLIGQGDGNVADVHEMYAQMVYKDNKIMELDSRIRQLEGSLMDVQETVKEKDQVIDARNRAIQLMTEDLSLRKKNVVDQLDDTRDEMRQMQFKFSTLETEWNEEKQSLLQNLETEKEEFKLKITDKDNKLIHFEESLKNMESIRFELSTRNAQLQEKVVLLQESLEKIKKNVSNDNTKELKLEIQAMKEQLNEKEAIINSLQLSEKENSSKQQKTPGESKSLVKIKAQYVSRIKNLEKQLEAMQKSADESQVYSQRIAELESANEELNARLENQQKYLVEKDENLVKASDRQAKVKDLLENFCKSHGVIEPTAEAIEEGLSKVSLDKEKLKNYVENLCKRFSVASMDELESVFDSLESKEAGLIKEIETYQSEIEKWKSEIERYKSNIEDYELYVETYRSDIETYKSDIETYKLDIVTYKSDIETYKSDIRTYISDIESYKSDIESYKVEIESYKTDKKNSKIEMKKIQEKLIQVQGDLEQLKVSSKEEKDLLNEKIQKQDEEFNNIKLENDQLVTDAQKKLQKIQKMEIELTEKDKKLKEANEMMENKIAVISGDRERELMEFQKRLSRAGNLEQKYEHVAEVMNEKMKEMETNIFNLTSQLAEKEKEINELQQKSELHLKEIEDLNSKWKDEVEYYQKEIEDKNLNVQQLELSVKCKLDSSSEINSKLQEDLKCAQDLLGVEKLHCQELKEGIEEAEKKLSNAEKELEEQVEKMSILQNKLKDEEEIKRNELAKMQEMFDSNKLEFERRLETFHQEEADLMKLKSELEEKLSEKVLLINELYEKCSQLEKQIELESAEKCQAVEECEKLTKDFELFKVYTEEGLKALQDDNEKLTELRDSKQEQEELLKEMEEKYKSEIENLLSKLEIQNNLLKEKDELKILCDKSTEKNNKLTSYIIELENDLSNLAESRDKTMEEKQSLDAQLMELKASLEEGQRSLIVQQEEFNKKIELLTAENKEKIQISVGKLKLLEEENEKLIQNVKRSEELTMNTAKEKEEVNEILENLKREKESLIEIMKQGDMDLNNLRKEKEVMEKDYEEKDKIINQLKNLNIKNEEKILGLLETIERLNQEKEQAVSSTMSAEESFNVAYNEMKEKFEMVKNELKMVQNDSIEKNNQLEKVDNELKEIHEKNLNLEKLLQDKMMEIESLEEVQKEFQEVRQRYEDLNNKRVHEIDDSNKRNLEVESTIDKLQELIQEKNSENEELIKLKISTQENYEQCKIELENQLQIKTDELVELRNELEKRISELKCLSVNCEDLQFKLSSSLEEVDKVNEEKSAFKTELEVVINSYEEKLRDIQLDIQEKERQREEIAKSSHQSLETQVQTLNDHANELNKQKTLLESELLVSNENYSKIKNDFEANAFKLREVTESCMEFENQIAKKCAEYEAIITNKESEIEKLSNECKELNSFYEDLKLRFSLSLEEISTLIHDKDELSKQLEIVTMKYEEIKTDSEKHVINLHERNSELESILAVNEKKLLEIQEELNARNVEIEKLQNDCEVKSKLETELMIVIEERIKLSEDIDKLNEDFRIVQRQCEEKLKEEVKYRQRAEEMSENLKQENEKLLDYLNRKESEIKQLQIADAENLMQKEQQIEQLSARNVELEASVAQLQQVIEEKKLENEQLIKLKNDTQKSELDKETVTRKDEIVNAVHKLEWEWSDEWSSENVRKPVVSLIGEASNETLLEENMKLKNENEDLKQELKEIIAQHEKMSKIFVPDLGIEGDEKCDEGTLSREEEVVNALHKLEEGLDDIHRPVIPLINETTDKTLLEENKRLKNEIEVLKQQLKIIIAQHEKMSQRFVPDLCDKDISSGEDIKPAERKLDWEWSEEWGIDNIHRPATTETSNETLTKENLKLKSEIENLQQQLKTIIAQHEKMSQRFVPDLGIEGDKKCDEVTLSREEEVVNALHKFEEGLDDIHRPVIPIINETTDKTLLEENKRLKNEIEVLKQQLKIIIAQHEKMSQRFVPDLCDKDISSGEDIKPAERKLEWEWSEEWGIDNIHRPATTETSNETLTEENLKLKSEIENLQQQLKTIIAQHEKMSQRFVPDLGIEGDKKCDEVTLSREEEVVNALHKFEEGLDDIHKPVIPIINETTDKTLLEENKRLKNEIEALKQQLKEIIAQHEKMSQRFVPDLCDKDISSGEDIKPAERKLEWEWSKEWGIDNIHKPNSEIGNETMFDVNAKLKNEIEHLKQQLKEMISKNEKMSQRFVPDLGTEEKIKCVKETSSREEEIVNAVQILEQEVDDFHRPEIPVINETTVETLLEENKRLKNEIEDLKQQLKEIIAQHEKMSQRFVPDLCDKDISSGEDIKPAVHKLEWEWSEEWGIDNIHRPATTETSNETLTEENLKLKSEIEDLKQQLKEIIAKNENMTETFVPDLGSGKDPEDKNSNSVKIQISEDSGWEDNSTNETLVEENRKLKFEIEELRTQLRQLISEHEVMTKTYKMDLGLENLSEKNTQLLQDLAESQNQVDSHLREMEVLRNSAKELSDEKNKLTVELDTLREENETVMSDFNELNKLYQQEKDELEKLKLSIDQKMNVNIENERLVGSSSEVDELKLVKIKNSKMLVKLKQFKEKSDKQQTEIAQLNDKLTTLNEKVDMLEVSNGNLVEIKDQLENKVEELSLKMNNLSQEKMNVEKQMKLLNEEQVLKLKDFMQEKTILNNQLKKLSEEKERLQRETIASKEQTEILMSDNNTFQIIVENLNQAKVRMDEEMRQYATQVYHLMEDKEKLQHQVDNFNDLKIKYEEIQQNQKKTEIRCSELQQELNELQEKCENYQVQNEGLRRDKVELELKLAQTSDDDKLEMEEIFQTVEKDKIELEGRVLELTRIVKEIGTERDEIAEKLHISGQIVNEKEMEIESIQNGASKLKLELEQLQTKLQIANKNDEESKLLIEEFTQRNNSLVEEIDRISSTESDLLQRMSVMEKEFEHLQTEHQNLNQIFNESKINGSETNLLKDKINNLEMELNQSVHLLHEREYQCNNFTQDIAQLIDEKSNLQMNLSSLTKNSHQLEIKIDELENLLEEERRAHTPKQPQSSDLLLNIEENQPLIIPETNFTLTRTMRGTAWRIQNWIQGRSMCGNPILHL